MAKTRRVASILYLASILLTLFFAFALPERPRKPLVFLSMVFQYFAFLWYSLSYIPFGRKLLKKIAKWCCCGSEE